MTLIHMDSLSEMGTAKRTLWNTGPSYVNATGRDALANGALLMGDSVMHLLTLPASAGIVCGAAFLCNSTSGSPAHTYFSVWGDTRTVQHLTVTFATATGLIELRRGSSTGTVLATAAVALPALEWRYLEFKAVVHASAGVGVVKLDGTTIINFSGNTQNGGVSTNIDGLGIARGISTNFTVDDLWVCNLLGTAPTNDFLGDCRVERKVPNGNGAASTWIGSDGNSVDNYLLCDENPANTTDYTGRVTTATGNQDLYAMEDIVAPAPTIIGVQPFVYAAKTDAGVANVKTVCRAATGTMSKSANLALSTTYVWYDGPILSQTPDTTAWTTALVNSTQVGIEVG